MKRRPWEVSRRTILGGAGTALGLPVLEAMLPGLKRARAAGACPPKRVVFFIISAGTPDGFSFGTGRPGCFQPPNTGPDYTLSPILKPMADFKKNSMVITGLHNLVAMPADPSVGNHQSLTSALLTGCRLPSLGNMVAGISVDQVVANAFKACTPGLPSLFMNPFHEQNSYEYNSWYSWTAPASPKKVTIKSSDVFGQVFGDAGADPATRKRRLAYKTSVLDHAKADADRIHAKVGKADRQILDQYLTSVHDLEARITATSAVSGGTCASGAAPADPGAWDAARDETGSQMQLRTKQMLDMMTLAFQCDRTRVATCILGHSGHGLHFDWLPGVDPSWEYHGDMTHIGGKPENVSTSDVRLDGYQAVATWQISAFAGLVRRLAETPEGDGSGSLLDNTLLLCTSEMRYGDGHIGDHLPVILAGGGGGSAITMGRHIEVAEQPIANLYVSMLNAVGIPTTQFASSTGALQLG